MAESSVIVVELDKADRALLVACHEAMDRAAFWRKLSTVADGALIAVWLGWAASYLCGWIR